MNAKAKRAKQSDLDKDEVNAYFKEIEHCFSQLNIEDQKKIEFAEYFLSKLQLYNLEGIRIHIAELDYKTLKFFIYSVVLDYESWLAKREFTP